MDLSSNERKIVSVVKQLQEKERVEEMVEHLDELFEAKVSGEDILDDTSQHRGRVFRTYVNLRAFLVGLPK